MELVIVAMVWVGCGLLGAVVAPAGRSTLGFMLGLFFGPFGVLIAAVVRPAPPQPARRPLTNSGV